MQKGGGMSFWPKPILHPNRPQGDDLNMIIINKCGFTSRKVPLFNQNVLDYTSFATGIS
jgi:hypothetical protein